MMFRAVFWVILPCKVIVDNQFTRQYNPEDSSELNKMLVNNDNFFSENISTIKMKKITAQASEYISLETYTYEHSQN
jgi:hypothetical protein